MSRRKTEGGKCSFVGCERISLSKGLCTGHYKQYIKGGNLTPLRKKHSNVSMSEDCMIVGCDGEAYCKDMCRSHYDKAMRAIKKRKKNAKRNPE